MELPSNTLLQNGKYKIIQKIGQGGFGIAYKAYQQGLQREVCIKEFFFYDLCERARNSSNITIISTSPEKIQLVATFKRKFLKEANRLKQFQHPNIVSVLDSFEENNTAYFVMEYLEGGSLEDLLDREGKMSEQNAIETILPIISAMVIVHKADLLHLDIKPANIMLRIDQTPVLIDFGISKYMEIAAGYTTTAPVGISKGYAPLEQYGGNVKDFTKATDIYSICATIYRMVTGVIPPEPLQFIGGKLKSPLEYNSQLSVEFNNAIIKGMSITAISRQQDLTDLIRLFIAKQKIKTEVITTIEQNQNKFKLKNYISVWNFKDGLAKVQNINGCYGFINKLGKEIVPTNSDYLGVNGIECYDYLDDFSEGLCMFRNRQHYSYTDICGFIDKTGKVILSNYEDAKSFVDGIAAVKSKGKWGFIDKKGKQLIPFKYDDIDNSFGGPFKEGLALVKLNDKWGYIDNKGNEVTDNKGNEVTLCKYEYQYGSCYSEGLFKVKLNGKYGFIDSTGREVIQCKYTEISTFNEGLAAFKLNEKWGFIDKKGDEVIPCKYDSLSIYKSGIKIKWSEEGFCVAKLNGKWGFIDKAGLEVIPFMYDDVKLFYEGMAAVKLNDKYGFIDINGREVISFKYNDANLFGNGLVSVKLNGKWGFINKFGYEVIPFKYDNAINFIKDFANVQLDGKWGIIDKNDNLIIPIKHDSILSNTIIDLLNGKYGNIEIETICKYERINPFYATGFYLVMMNGKKGIINNKGHEVISCKYDEISSLEKEFQEGLAAVKLNDKWVYIDEECKVFLD